MISEIELYLIGKNIHSVITVCQNCGMQGINFPLETPCGNCGSEHTVRYYDHKTIHEHLTPKK